MPVITSRHSRQAGILVQVQIGLSRPEILRLRTANHPIAQPVIVTALIDTGAESSCVDPSVVSRVALPYRGSGLTQAPGVATGPAILGGSLPLPTYEAGLSILHPSGKPRDHLTIETLHLDELALASFGIEAVIGRDVLSQCVLVYDGPAGSVTLAY